MGDHPQAATRKGAGLPDTGPVASYSPLHRY